MKEYSYEYIHCKNEKIKDAKLIKAVIDTSKHKPVIVFVNSIIEGERLAGLLLERDDKSEGGLRVAFCRNL